MNKILLTILISGFIFLSSHCPVFAQELSLEINSTSFVPGNSINITVNVNNYSDYSLQYVIQSVLTHSDKDNFARPIEKELTIESGAGEEIQLYNLFVEDDFPSGQYDVKVDLFGEGRLVQTENLDFTISGVKRLISIVNLLVCKDSNCENPGKVFKQGEYIYLNYNSDTARLTTSAKLIYPNGQEKTINLPASIQANQIGTYKLKLSASRSGYSDKEAGIQFGVIKSAAKIKTPFGARTIEKPVYDDYSKDDDLVDDSKDVNLPLKERIKILLDKINQLKQQLSEMRGEKTSVWSHNFIQKLKYGDKGAEVVALQTALKKQGFTEAGKDAPGEFGRFTASAVVGFQEKYAKEILSQYGLAHGTGFVGPSTLKKLNDLYK